MRKLSLGLIVAICLALGAAPAPAHIPDDCMYAYDGMLEERKNLREPLDLYWMLEDEGMLYSIDREMLLEQIIEPTFRLTDWVTGFYTCIHNRRTVPPSPKEGHEAYELLACEETAARTADTIVAVTATLTYLKLFEEHDEEGSITLSGVGEEGYKTGAEHFHDLKENINKLSTEKRTLVQCLNSQSASNPAE